MLTRSSGWAAVVAVCLSHLPAGAQVVPRDEKPARVVSASRLRAALRLDGRLDEPVYGQVPATNGFVQYEPVNGQPATEDSDVWVFYDERNLYISVRNWDSHPERMVANELRHDSTALTQNEQVTVTLDTFHDRRNGYTFLVNALGGMMEEAFTDERNPSRDWNTVWNAKVSRVDGGWSVEMMIPFRSIRYRPGSDSWGIQIGRSIKWKNEITFLAPLPVLAGPPVYRVSYGAALVGLHTPPAATLPDIKPSLMSGVTTDRTVPAGSQNSENLAGSLDVKYPFARGLTADLTVNTDFAQVEEDEQQVNLTRFSLFFPEKREFFLEGQGIFNFGGQGSSVASDVPILFFSRAIGLVNGQRQRILAGGRVTGKAGAYSIGLVNIHTQDEPTTGARATNFSVVRVRRDVLRNGAIGFLMTDRSRAIGSTNAHNVVAGIDGVFTFAQYLRMNTYIARTQTEARQGDQWSYRGQLDYSRDRYGVAIERLKVGDGFNPEVGFVRRTDFTRTNALVRFSPRPHPGGALVRRVRKFSYEGTYNHYQRGDGAIGSYDLTALMRSEFQTGDVAAVQYTYNDDRPTTPFAIASGVQIPAGAYQWRLLQAAYTFGTQRRLSGTVTTQAGSFYTGTQKALSYRGRLAVARSLAIEPSVSINWIDLREGRFIATVASGRVTVPLTARMLASALLQYNSSAHVSSTSVRYRWEYQPGSELFVVYTEGRDTLTLGFPDLATRGLAFKVTRFLRR